MTPNELSAQIKTGLSGGYFFYGREEYLKRFYLGRIRTLILGEDDTLAAFNHYRLKWGENSIEEIESALKSVPMMAEKTLVEISCDFTKIKDHGEMSEFLSDFDRESTIVVILTNDEGFEAGNPAKNKPSEAYKKYSAAFNMVFFDTQTPSELKKWMARRLAKEKLQITTDATENLLLRCGKEMMSLAGELDKLAACAAARGLDAVTSELVFDITCTSEEENAFALANAIMNGDRKTALHELAACKKRQEKAPIVLGSVSKAMNDMMSVSLLMQSGMNKSDIAKSLKIHEYRTGLYMEAVRNMEPERLRAAINRCREADVLMKSSRLDYIALERLVCTIPAKPRIRRG